MTSEKDNDQFMTNREVMRDIHTSVKSIDAKVGSIETNIKSIEETVYGNTQKNIPGNTQDIAMLKKFKTKLERGFIWLSGATIVTGGAAFKDKIWKFILSIFGATIALFYFDLFICAMVVVCAIFLFI